MTSTTQEAPQAPEWPEWMSPHDVARYANCHVQTVYKALRAREIAHNKLSSGPRAHVRIRRADVEAWLGSRRVEAR